MKKALAALGCLGVLLLTLVLAALAAVVIAIDSDSTSTPANLENIGFGGSIAYDAPVPADVKTLIVTSISRYGCGEVTPSLIAAQLYSESNFRPDAQSKDPGTGAPIADGIAQFTPATWKAYGVDGNRDAVKDVWNPQDAIPAAIAYDCYLADLVKDVPGDATGNMLAAYNAGPHAVKKAGGIPPYTETRTYVKKIRKLATAWASPVDGGLLLAEVTNRQVHGG